MAAGGTVRRLPNPLTLTLPRPRTPIRDSRRHLISTPTQTQVTPGTEEEEEEVKGKEK